MNAAEATSALEAVRDALDIPHAATVGDDETRAKIIEARVMHAVTFLRSILDTEPYDPGWHVAYLRDRLAEHPATGYRTWDEAVAETRAVKAAQAEPCGRCGAGVARPGETRPDGQPRDRSRYCDACIDRCHEATDFAHVCQICPTPEEARRLGYRSHA